MHHLKQFADVYSIGSLVDLLDFKGMKVPTAATDMCFRNSPELQLPTTTAFWEDRYQGPGAIALFQEGQLGPCRCILPGGKRQQPGPSDLQSIFYQK